jgi:hypothetical protein
MFLRGTSAPPLAESRKNSQRCGVFRLRRLVAGAGFLRLIYRW